MGGRPVTRVPSEARRNGDGASADVRRGAQTVHRAIDILEAFSLDRPSLGLAEICEAVNLTVPTTHRLLKALQHKEMVFWDPLSRRYSLGAGVMRLASLILNRDDLTASIQPSLEYLRNQTHETVGFHGLIDNERVCLVELVSPLPIRMASGVGTAYPLYAGAAGKALLALMPDDQVDRLLNDASKAKLLGADRRNALRRELPQIRSAGYATSRGETVAGAAAIATAVVNASGAAVGAINITGPADRMTVAKTREFAAPLLKVTAEVMRQLGAAASPSAPDQGAQNREARRSRTSPARQRS
jgi:DNA-binding IclR family transcriptional regulator